MMNPIQDKSRVEYQRRSWNTLSNRIDKLVNHTNATNIYKVIRELREVNLIRGRGLFCRSCMNLQTASPSSTDALAALVAAVNSQYYEVGNLLVRRVILELRSAFESNDKPRMLSAAKFLSHLVNQRVVHTLIAFEVTELLLKKPTNDGVEMVVVFVLECGSTLQDLCPLRLSGIFARFGGIFCDGKIDERVQFLIECLFAEWKAKFQGYPAIRPELDVVDQENQLTHEVSLHDEIDAEIALDTFSPDPHFAQNKKIYEELIVDGESGDETNSDGTESYSDEDDEEDDEQMMIDDETKINLVNLRRRMCLTIMTSDDYREAGRKLLNIKLEPGQEMELCIMLLECCSQEKTYLPYYGLLGQAFCTINRIYQQNFEKCFVQEYSMIHQLETNELRNIATFFANLLGTDALPWRVLGCIRLTGEETTSSSRSFIKFLFLELSCHFEIKLLNERLSDPRMQDSFKFISTKDNPMNMRFAINFFTSIGLGRITENLQEHLKNLQQRKDVPESDSASASSGSESDSSSSESGGSESESESDSYHTAMSQSDSENDSDDEWVKITKSTRKLVL